MNNMDQPNNRTALAISRLYLKTGVWSSVEEPEPPFLAGAVKKGAAPALQLKLQLNMTPGSKKR